MTQSYLDNPKASGYRQIALELHDAMRSGQLQQGERLPPHITLARQMKVNPTTVRRAYELLESQGMVFSKQGLGTFVSKDARENMNRGQSRTLGRVVVVCGVDDLSQASAQTAFITLRILAGFNRVTNGCGPTPEIVRSLTPDLLERLKKDDVVMVRYENQQTGYDVVSDLLRRDICVLTFFGAPTWPGVPHLDYDRHHAVQLACQHLIELGYTSIGYLGRKTHHQLPVDPKFVSFLVAMNSAGLTVNPAHTRNVPIEPGAAYAIAQKMIAEAGAPQALFIDTDYKALEVIRALNDAGLSVPKDVAIVSYDDIPESASCSPALTTIHTPQYELGEHAARMLSTWNRGGPAPASVTLQARLVIRDTTRR